MNHRRENTREPASAVIFPEFLKTKSASLLITYVDRKRLRNGGANWLNGVLSGNGTLCCKDSCLPLSEIYLISLSTVGSMSFKKFVSIWFCILEAVYPYISLYPFLRTLNLNLI